MRGSFKKIVQGYWAFRDKYAHGDASVMQYLAGHGQKPKVMVVACCDARVDPALLLQCEPGDLFVARNVANIVHQYEKDSSHHGTSAALEFAVRVLKVEHLILLGHSQCGGIQSLVQSNTEHQDDFITSWMSVVKTADVHTYHADDYAKLALQQSRENCMTFPWIKEEVDQGLLALHIWFFDIKTGQIFAHSATDGKYHPLDETFLENDGEAL